MEPADIIGIINVIISAASLVLSAYAIFLKNRPSSSYQPPLRAVGAQMASSSASDARGQLHCRFTTLQNHHAFIPLILFTRLVLILPHTGRVRLQKKDVLQSIAIGGGFVVANFVTMRSAVRWRDVLGGLKDGGFAVKTLGRDMELWILICMILSWGGGI